jgi:hypothetical protein
MIKEKADSFARRHCLENYLDRPADLNEMILKLLELKEAMQFEQARQTGNDRPGGRHIKERYYETIGKSGHPVALSLERRRTERRSLRHQSGQHGTDRDAF